MAYRPTPAGPRNIRELFHWLWRELTKIGKEIDGGGGGGEANTASNLGTGEGLATLKQGVDLPFKSLVAGANVTLTPTATEITIASTGGGTGGDSNTSITVNQPGHGFVPGQAITQNGSVFALALANSPDTLALGIVVEVIDASNFIYGMAGEFPIIHTYQQDQYYYLSETVPGSFQIDEPTYSQPLIYINAPGRITVYPYRPSVGGLPPVFAGAGTSGYVPDPGVELGYVLSDSGDWVAGGTGGDGQSNTSSNQGGGFELALAKVGVDLPFRTLVAGDNITIDLGSDTLTLNSSGGGGGDQFNIDGGMADSIYNPPVNTDGGNAAGV